MSNSYHFSEEWDDDELVPLSELRPSREIFGPLAKAPAKARKSTPERARRSGERPALPSARDGDRPRRATVETGRHVPAPRHEQVVDVREPSARHDVQAPSGWRGAVTRASGGSITVGPSAKDRRIEELRSIVRRPVADGTVAVFSRKGGVGKTTISAYLGLMLAMERQDRVVALDGDAEAGSLGWLLAPKAPSTLAALASADPVPSDYEALRRYTVSTPEGLEVIIGDPAESGPISTTGLEAVAHQLGRHYDVAIFDTGAGVTRATGRALVTSARVLLLVMGPSVDSVRAAERTLAWLDERPGEAAGEDVHVIAVINGISSNIKPSHIDKIEQHFADRCAAVVRIPWDAHLATGSATVALDRLAKPTRKAFLELAATTVGILSGSSRRSEVAGARHG